MNLVTMKIWVSKGDEIIKSNAHPEICQQNTAAQQLAITAVMNYFSSI